MRLTRRVAGVGAAALALARPAFADDLAAGLVQAVKTQMAALPDGPVLLNSYLLHSPSSGADAFDLTQANAAYVYDNALAGLLLLAAGERASARRIGDALATAQAHDRFFRDGRLRNCYQAGAMAAPAKLAGFWNEKTQQWDEDPYQVGTDTGPLAWAMLLWAALGMRAPADAAGDFLDARLRTTRGYYGGFYGFDASQIMLTWQSTEQNTDLVAAFRNLDRAEDAAHAESFVRAAFDPQDGVFKAGSQNAILAADAGIWPYLAGIGSPDSARKAIAALRHGGGIGFSNAGDGIWLEGTSFAALALKKMKHRLADAFLATVAANLSPEGYVYATVAPTLSTGLAVGPGLQGAAALPFNYYRRPSLSATSWAGLAALGADPLALHE